MDCEQAAVRPAAAAPACCRDELATRQAQKLEAVGRLAAGIAHEINTPIQFVGDNTHFLRDAFASLQRLLDAYAVLCDAAAAGQVAPSLLAAVHRAEAEADLAYLSEEIPRALEQVLEGVERVASIVRALKEFAHPARKERAPADLNQALQSTLTVARNELKYVAEVQTDFAPLPPVLCQIGDLNQVFLNLLVNAAHAIADQVGDSGARGTITVRTRALGTQVEVAISDTGPGIPAAIRDRIFDPFFTTKAVGRGTGQGLALARAIVVEQHGGELTFESVEGAGTTFYVRLPVTGGAAASAQP
jgi:signal transduction histidine kinase